MGIEVKYDRSGKVNLQPPYERSKAIDVSAVDYNPADDEIIITEIRCSTAGDIKYDNETDTGVVYPAADGDILRVIATKIYSAGTTATGITVHGFTQSA